MCSKLKKCLFCDKEISGRSDKKYCDDYCRATYYNKENRIKNNLVRNINSSLRRNYKILSNLNTLEKTKVKHATLVSLGFNFSFFTSIYQTKKKKTYYFVYDQGYLELENGYFLLVKRETAL